jgi:hypothetical protein
VARKNIPIGLSADFASAGFLKSQVGRLETNKPAAAAAFLFVKPAPVAYSSNAPGFVKMASLDARHLFLPKSGSAVELASLEDQVVGTS